MPASGKTPSTRIRRLAGLCALLALPATAVATSPVLLREFVADAPPTAQSHATTLVQASDGDLLAAWFGGSHEGASDVRIWLSRRTDSGWGAPQAVADGADPQGAPLPTWNPVLFEPRNGPLMLFYKIGPDPRHWLGLQRTSTDGGRTWSAAKRLPDGLIGPVRSPPMQLRDGSLLSPSSTEDAGWRIHFERLEKSASHDWKRMPPIPNPARIEAIQPVLLPGPDGNLLALGRTRQDHVFATTSHDDGRHWQALRLLDLPNPNAAIDAVRLADGRYLMAFNPNVSGKDWWNGRDRLDIALSEDGEHWTAVLTLEDEPGQEFSYPAMIQTRDGRVHVAYTWKRQRIRHVVLDPAQLAFPPAQAGAGP